MSENIDDLMDLGDAMESFDMDDAEEKNAELEGKSFKAKRKPAHYYRHQAFVREYLKNGNNGAQAYMKVYGTKDNNQAGQHASHLLDTESIQKHLEKERDLIARNHNIDVEENIRTLHTLIEDCLNDGDRHHLTKAIDMLNKMSGQYTHKQQIDHKHDGITFNFIKPENPKDSE